jgi:hypothetical protein
MMAKERRTKTWRTVVIVVVIVLALFALANILLAPRFEAWFRNKYPEVYSLRKTLGSQYPNYKFGISDRTDFGSGGQTKNVI